MLWYYSKGEVYRFDSQTQVVQQVKLPSKATFFPALSPDGHYLAYADDANLRVIQTSNLEVVLTVPHLETARSTNLTDTQFIPVVWSPDDQWLLLGMRRYEQEGLGLLNVSNFKIVEVTRSDGYRFTCGFTGAVWAPDSSKIIFTQEQSQTCEWGSSPAGVAQARPNAPQSILLFTNTVASQNGQSSIIGSAAEPTWEPTANWLAFSQEIDQAPQSPNGGRVTRLFLIRPDGSEPHPVSSNVTGMIHTPVWDETGERLFFSSYQADSASDGVYQSKPDGTEAKLVVDGVGLAPIAISPDNDYLAYGEQNTDMYFITIAPSWKLGFWIQNLANGQTKRFDSAVFLGWQ